MRRALGVAALAAILVAWTPIDSTRPVWSGSVPYQMNSAGSADLGAAMSESIVQQAFGDWTHVSCTSLTATYGGQTSSRPTSGDGRAVVGWVESGWRYDTSAIGVTQPQWTTGHGGPTIREADMELNGVNYTWIAGSGRGNSVNAYSIVLHESGHYYGLGHSTSSSATMFYAYSGGISALTSDDETGICTLYPGSGSPDCRTMGCPTGQMCDASGTCVAQSGCSTDAQCSGGQHCNTATRVCETSSGGGLGANCTVGDECASGICLNGACSATCDGLNPTSCGTGFYCNGRATGTCGGEGLCQAGTAGAGAIGMPCTDNTECAGLFCAEGVCSSPCTPGTSASCPVGYACQVGTTASCGSCQMTGQLGDACAMGVDCATRICVNGACSEICDVTSGTGCPDMFLCMANGASGACVASSGGLGAPCHGAPDCLSGQCAQTGSSTFCTRVCDAVSPCPRGYTCVTTGDGTSHICEPRNNNSCGCSAVGSGSGGSGALAVLVMAALALARRRRG